MDRLIRGASKPAFLRTVCNSCRRKLQHDVTRLPRRTLQTSHHHRQNTQGGDSNSTQAHPLGDFYADLLSKPIPKESTATTHLTHPPTSTPTPTESQSSTRLPSFVDTGGDLTKEERAARLFGSIRGSGYERQTAPESTWQTINGVPVPPRPSEPDNCCMSGCVHCVWDDYRDDIEDWASRLKEVQRQAKASGPETREPKVDMPRPEVATASTSMDDDGGGSEGLWTQTGDEDELFAGIPVGIREFMNVEKKIRERKKKRIEGST